MGDSPDQRRPKERRLQSADGRYDFLLPASGVVTIGRSEAATFVILDPAVSRLHRALSVDGDRVLLEDRQSTAGSYVNNHAAVDPTPVMPGDVIRLGPVDLTLIERSESAQEALTGAGTAGADPPRTSRWEMPPAVTYDAEHASPNVASNRHMMQPDLQPPGPMASSATARSKGDLVVTGVVRSPSLRSESWGGQQGGPTLQILTFTLLTYDSRGDRAEAIAVELRGLTVKGPAPVDGERVQVKGRINQDGVLECDQVRLIDTGAVVSAGGKRSIKAAKVALIVFGIIFVLALAGFGLDLLNSTGNNPFAPTVVIPAVRPGEQLSVVESRLRDAGLKTEWLQEDSGQVPFATVIRISPPAGSQVRQNSTVKICTNARLR